MFKPCHILDEKDSHLRKVSKEVTFPLSKEDKKLIQQANTILGNTDVEGLTLLPLNSFWF